jgi:hypothetical protein
MVIVFFDVRGVIMIECLYGGQTLKQKYLQVLTKLQDGVYVCVCVCGRNCRNCGRIHGSASRQ